MSNSLESRFLVGQILLSVSPTSSLFNKVPDAWICKVSEHKNAGAITQRAVAVTNAINTFYSICKSFLSDPTVERLACRPDMFTDTVLRISVNPAALWLLLISYSCCSTAIAAVIVKFVIQLPIVCGLDVTLTPMPALGNSNRTSLANSKTKLSTEATIAQQLYPLSTTLRSNPAIWSLLTDLVSDNRVAFTSRLLLATTYDLSTPGQSLSQHPTRRQRASQHDSNSNSLNTQALKPSGTDLFLKKMLADAITELTTEISMESSSVDSLVSSLVYAFSYIAVPYRVILPELEQMGALLFFVYAPNQDTNSTRGGRVRENATNSFATAFGALVKCARQCLSIDASFAPVAPAASSTTASSSSTIATSPSFLGNGLFNSHLWSTEEKEKRDEAIACELASFIRAVETNVNQKFSLSCLRVIYKAGSIPLSHDKALEHNALSASFNYLAGAHRGIDFSPFLLQLQRSVATVVINKLYSVGSMADGQYVASLVSSAGEGPKAACSVRLEDTREFFFANEGLLFAEYVHLPRSVPVVWLQSASRIHHKEDSVPASLDQDSSPGCTTGPTPPSSYSYMDSLAETSLDRSVEALKATKAYFLAILAALPSTESAVSFSAPSIDFSEDSRVKQARKALEPFALSYPVVPVPSSPSESFLEDQGALDVDTLKQHFPNYPALASSPSSESSPLVVEEELNKYHELQTQIDFKQCKVDAFSRRFPLIVGADSESTLSLANAASRSALLQLYIGSVCFLIDLFHYDDDVDEVLSLILNDPRTAVVGVAFDKDLDDLRKLYRSTSSFKQTSSKDGWNTTSNSNKAASKSSNSNNNSNASKASRRRGTFEKPMNIIDLPTLNEQFADQSRYVARKLPNGQFVYDQRVSLKRMVKSFLFLDLFKGSQTSNWSERPLSPAKVAYSAIDAWVQIPLLNALCVGIDPEALKEFIKTRVTKTGSE